MGFFNSVNGAKEEVSTEHPLPERVALWQLTTDTSEEAKIKATLEALAIVFGAPYIGLKRAVDVVETGDPWLLPGYEKK